VATPDNRCTRGRQSPRVRSSRRALRRWSTGRRRTYLDSLLDSCWRQTNLTTSVVTFSLGATCPRVNDATQPLDRRSPREPPRPSTRRPDRRRRATARRRPRAGADGPRRLPRGGAHRTLFLRKLLRPGRIRACGLRRRLLAGDEYPHLGENPTGSRRTVRRTGLFTAYLDGRLGATRKQFIDYCVNALFTTAAPYVPSGDLGKAE
jgi:hypothetical protein